MAAQKRNMWDNELEMRFLELYHSETVLWDSQNPLYKDKKLNHDAWKRINTEMNIEIHELKKKKDSLLSSYRLYRKKVRDSIRSGAGAEDIYKLIWFAYTYMDSFLGEGLTVRKTTDTLQDSNVGDLENQENVDPVPPSIENVMATPITKRRRKDPPELEEAGSFIKESLANLNQALSRNNFQEKEDDCDRYGKILANKLRQLPEDERLIFMHQIDGMFIQRRSVVQNYFSSPTYVSTPSPSPNILQPIFHNTTDNTQYSPTINIPEQSNTSTIRILSNEIIRPPSQTETFSQTNYNLITDAYDKS